ncbi:hypothetical protein SCHPADRAFT_940828 [Schizopora paradoxa]|uniref:Wings apart-like protein C-terminal domain-containing protein n=1 Tax=Schizopora paradoxa TaxID=27342 RepID=A0A0H2S7Z7_9AGAM|nr:hypothetical protein SCHPADRAFT_940828 [Schizopora paradoxa]
MSSSRNVRTYSRRSSLKNPTKRASESDEEVDERPAKRQAVGGPTTPKHSDIATKPGESSRIRLSYDEEDGVKTDVDDEDGDDGMRESTPVPMKNGGRGKLSGQNSVTSSPSKVPQNLSNLFDTVFSSSPNPSVSSSPSRSPGKTSRMLGRSKTDSSIESSPSKASSFGTRSQSFATSTKSARSQPQSQELLAATSTNDHDDTPRRANASGRTYAGQSRSFLVAVPVSSLPNHLGEQVAEFAANDEEFRDSYSDLRKRWGIDNSENDAYNEADPSGSQTPNEDNLNNVLFSITDLRSKGESRRFMDEAGYLFDGFDPSGNLSVWRSAATDLVINLVKPDFFKNAKAADFLGKIWALLRSVGAGDGDKVLDAVLSCFIALLKADSRDVSSLSAKPDFVPACIKLLEACQDDGDQIGSLDIFSNFDLSQMGIKRPEKLMLQRLRTSISQSTFILPHGCEPSIRCLISSTCATVPNKFYRRIGAIVGSLSREISCLSRRTSAFISGLPLLPEHGWNHEGLCLEHASNCLHILDSYLVDLQYGNISDDFDWNPESPDLALSERLVTLITFVNALEMSNSNPPVSHTVAVRCAELAFRILINLTNGNKAWCKLVSRNPSLVPQLVRSIMGFLQASSDAKHGKIHQKDDQAAPFDRLCLALGVLTNVIHEEKTLTRQLRKTKYKPTCKKSACLNGCNCAEANNGLSCLCTVFSSLSDIEDGYTVSEIQYVKGHMALLLGLLCNSASDCLDILSYLRGSTNQSKLAHLVETIEDFSTAYKSFSQHVAGDSIERGSADSGQEATPESKPEIVTNSPIAAQVSQMTANVLEALHSFERELFE